MTVAMTERLVKRIADSRWDEGASALHFVCGSLLQYDAARGRSPYEGLDVERVFAAVGLLAERQSLEVSPFVASWHPAVDLWDQRRSEVPPFWDQEFGRALGRGGRFSDAGKAIAGLVDKVMSGSPTGEVYARLAERMLSELKELLITTERDVAYLTPLAAIARERTALTIATLNYDLSVEQCARTAGVPCTTGIESWVRDGRWGSPVGGIQLLKLHGSLDWAWEKVYEEGHLPRKVVRVVADPLEDQGHPAVVFGQRGKLRAEGPFLSLLAEFETAMADAEQLVVVGYSFRDDHVNELIRRWSAEDIRRTMLVVDPNWPTSFDHTPQDFRWELESHLVPFGTEGTSPFQPRLEIWTMPCSEALLRLAG